MARTDLFMPELNPADVLQEFAADLRRRLAASGIEGEIDHVTRAAGPDSMQAEYSVALKDGRVIRFEDLAS